ncbi:MAG: murein biosynthesis integral membrane protein MurJ [Vicinamibacterales bacterium]
MADSAPTAQPQESRLARSAGLIGIATMASRVLGVARDMIYARLFGAGDTMDAFNVAFRIPNLLRDLFAEGAMTAAFVPTFSRYLVQNGRPAAWRLGNLVLSTLLLVTLSLVTVGIVFADPLTRLFASDYAEVPGKLELTRTLAIAMFPFLTLVAVAVACMGMLNALRHFFVPALSPAMFNVGSILSVLILVPLAPVLGLHPAMALAIGVLVGGALQAVVQWPPLLKEGYRFRFELNLADPGLREILRLMIPGTLGLAAVQINQFVNTVLATGEGTGAVSWLNYAFRLMYLPIGLFGVSIATAAVPTLSTFAAQSDTAGLRRTVSSGLRLMLMLNVPATVGLIVLARPIVAVLFERGAFTPDDTAATAAALMFYAPGLLGYSAVKLASPTFYALKDSRTPVAVSIGSIAMNVVLNLTLVRVIGYRGLALGTALSALLNAMLLLVLLNRRIEGLEGRRVLVAFVKIAMASAVMAAVVGATAAWLERAWPATDFIHRTWQLGVSIGVGLVTLAGGARLLRIAEFDDATARILARLPIGR